MRIPLLSAARRQTPTLYCSFCRKSDRQVRKLVGGPGVHICDACVELSRRAVAGKPIPGFAGFESLSDDDLLATLAPASAAVDSAREALQQHIELLRGRGVSWAKIGAALGISRQAAWERFG